MTASDSRGRETASEKLRALDGDDFEVSWRLRNVLPLIADVVEAAERLAYAEQVVSPECGCDECRNVRALTALRDALEGGDE